mgnify:CR=1 FL=1
MSSILKVDQIQNAAGTTGLTIDSSGAVSADVITAEVKRTNIPYIQLLHNSNRSYSAASVISDWRVRQSNRITHSSGVLTIPEDGLYQVGVSLIASGTGGIYLEINGSRQFRISYGAAGTGEAWSAQSGNCILMLNANDTVSLDSETTNTFYGATSPSTVSSYYCYMIG